jgi:SAM-dependent MidA family methyltransferase
MVSQILPEHYFAPVPAHLDHPPAPSATALATSAQLIGHIQAEIARDGFMSFARFMELALYAPGMGYYAAGSTKFGAGGDYVTAPEISPLFGYALAAQAQQLLELGHSHILELGAGSGRLAADLLIGLERRGLAPKRYSILEVSAELRDRQRHTLAALVPRLFDRIEWLERLPPRFSGILIGNEVLDAMPVHLVQTSSGKAHELGIGCESTTGALVWKTRALTGELAAIAAELDLADNYTTEVHLAACGLVRSLANVLERGVAFFIDYGFPRREYYHAERDQGTLMCHYRQRAHTDPLVLIGLQDITAHLDFTALGEAAVADGLELLGYTSQAQFLINCGILEFLEAMGPVNVASYAPAVARVQKLLSPAEMGELFKVIAFGRGVSQPLLGFKSGNRSGTL